MKHPRAVLFWLLMWLAGVAGAHPSDVSQMRVHLGHDAVEFRLTLNVLTLSRIAVVDADHNRRITPQEIAHAVPAIVAWLKKQVLVSVNDTETDLGNFQRYECVWPHSDTAEVTDQEASQRFVDFNFIRPWPAGVREVWTGFQVFAQLGELHVVQAIYQQEGQPDLPVEFSLREPEYLYDTGWTAGEATAAPVIISQPARVPVMSWVVLVAGVFGIACWFAWPKRRH